MLRDLFSLFPAYAGVILKKALYTKSRKPFPRIRGGDPNPLQLFGRVFFFSPHTRG